MRVKGNSHANEIRIPRIEKPMAKISRSPYCCATGPFLLNGIEQIVEVLDHSQTIRRAHAQSGKPFEEITHPITRCGCYIEEIGPSPSGQWLITQRISGQGEWGYDVFRTSPLTWEGGIDQENGYILDLPRFSPDESFLVGGAGPGVLGGWWAHPEDDIEEPSRGGLVAIGFLFVHQLADHRTSRCLLQVDLPKGWLPDDPWAEWYGPREVTPTENGISMMPSWGAPFEIDYPIPETVVLPTPQPSGNGIL